MQAHSDALLALRGPLLVCQSRCYLSLARTQQAEASAAVGQSSAGFASQAQADCSAQTAAPKGWLADVPTTPKFLGLAGSWLWAAPTQAA